MEEILSIREWIKELKEFQYETDGSLGTRAIYKLNLPYRILSSGRNRVVYDLGNKVLKVAISIKGIEDNRNEFILYRKSPKGIRQYLCKVLESGEGWLIMRKAEQIPQNDQYKKMILEMMKEFVLNRIMPNDIFVLGRTEPEWRNLGINKKGQILIIDYGNFNFSKPIHPTYLKLLSKKIDKI